MLIANVAQPISLGLRVAFVAVLYLFLLWVARSALKDLGRTSAQIAAGSGAPVASAAVMSDATGFFPAAEVRQAAHRDPRLVVVEDLGSTNGTYLNEELLHGAQALHPGDRVRIGDSEFTYLDG